MINWYLSLDTEIKVSIISVIATTLISIVSVIIAILTLRQNNKIIKEANRPSISIFLETIATTTMRNNYLVIKNFGNTPGKIDSIECSLDIELICYTNPFKDMINCTLAPNQSIVTVCNTENIDKIFTFTINYSNEKRKFTDTSSINTKYTKSLVSSQNSTSKMGILEKTIVNATEELIKSKF